MNIAPDRLQMLKTAYYGLLQNGAPAQLAFMEVCVGENLSLLEVDEFWEVLIEEAQNPVEAGSTPEVVVAASQIKLSNLMAQISALKRIEARQETTPTEEIVYPAAELLHLAEGVLSEFSPKESISHSAVLTKVAQLDANYGLVEVLASRIFNVTEADGDDYRLACDKAESILTAAALLLLESKGYGFNPQTYRWVRKASKVDRVAQYKQLLHRKSTLEHAKGLVSSEEAKDIIEELSTIEANLKALTPEVI